MFNLTSLNKQSASWKILEICELCAASTDSQKMYSVNTLVAVDTNSIGGKYPLGGTEKARPQNNFVRTFVEKADFGNEFLFSLVFTINEVFNFFPLFSESLKVTIILHYFLQ